MSNFEEEDEFVEGEEIPEVQITQEILSDNLQSLPQDESHKLQENQTQKQNNIAEEENTENQLKNQLIEQKCDQEQISQQEFQQNYQTQNQLIEDLIINQLDNNDEQKITLSTEEYPQKDKNNQAESSLEPSTEMDHQKQHSDNIVEQQVEPDDVLSEEEITIQEEEITIQEKENEILSKEQINEQHEIVSFDQKSEQQPYENKPGSKQGDKDSSSGEEIIVECDNIQEQQISTDLGKENFVSGQQFAETTNEQIQKQDDIKDEDSDEFVDGEEIKIGKQQVSKEDDFGEGENIDSELPNQQNQLINDDFNDDQFTDGEEIEIQIPEAQELQQPLEDEEDEFEEGEIVEHEDSTSKLFVSQSELFDDSQTKLSQINKSQLTILFSEICQSFQCSLTKQFDTNCVPAQEFYPIEVNLDKNSVNSLLEREQSYPNRESNGLQTPSKHTGDGQVSQELKNAYLEQIKLYTLVWTKYQPYIQYIYIIIRLSDQFNFVIEYPQFETYDFSVDPSPKPQKGMSISSFPIPEPVRPGLQEILDLIPDYSKLLEPSFLIEQ